MSETPKWLRDQIPPTEPQQQEIYTQETDGLYDPPSVRQPVFWIPFAQSKLQKNFPCKMAFKNNAKYAGPQILNPLAFYMSIATRNQT